MYGANFHYESQHITLKPKPVNNKFNIDINNTKIFFKSLFN